MYVAGLVVPVPEENKEAYRKWAENGAKIFKKYGCVEIIESWHDFVPKGNRTDFYRAVDAQPGEKIVLTVQIWPDKKSFFAAERKMHDDEALEVSGEIPFDGARIVFGCFQPICTMGRD